MFIGELYQRYRIRGSLTTAMTWNISGASSTGSALPTYEDDEKRGSGLRLVAWGQGYVTWARRSTLSNAPSSMASSSIRTIPVLNWNVANAVTTMDPAGNRKIDKEKARFRIDGAVALAMALGLRARDRAGQPAFDVQALIG